MKNARFNNRSKHDRRNSDKSTSLVPYASYVTWLDSSSLKADTQFCVRRSTDHPLSEALLVGGITGRILYMLRLLLDVTDQMLKAEVQLNRISRLNNLKKRIESNPTRGNRKPLRKIPSTKAKESLMACVVQERKIKAELDDLYRKRTILELEREQDSTTKENLDELENLIFGDTTFALSAVTSKLNATIQGQIADLRAERVEVDRYLDTLQERFHRDGISYAEAVRVHRVESLDQITELRQMAQSFQAEFGNPEIKTQSDFVEDYSLDRELLDMFKFTDEDLNGNRPSTS